MVLVNFVLKTEITKKTLKYILYIQYLVQFWKNKLILFRL